MLTLPEKMYLLGYDVERGKLTGRQFRGRLLRAAALTELTIGGQITDSDGKAVTTSTKGPSDQFLASVLAEFTPDQPMRWRRLVDHGHRQAEPIVRSALIAKDVIDVKERKVLGVFSSNDISVANPNSISILRQGARDAVLSGKPASSVPTEDAALAVLAAAGEVSPVFSRGERRAHRQRLDELSDELGNAAPALRKTIRAIRAAIIASASAASSSGS